MGMVERGEGRERGLGVCVTLFSFFFWSMFLVWDFSFLGGERGRLWGCLGFLFFSSFFSFLWGGRGG